MKKTKTLLIGAAILIALPLMIISGCSSTSGIQGSSAIMEDGSGIQHSEYVIVNNPKVARGLQIVDIATQFTGNLLTADVTLVSKYSDTEGYQYKFAWFDSDGIELDAEGNTWTPFVMYGNETKSFRGVAPNPSAKQFKINIRLR